MNNAYSLSKQDAKKILKGLGIALAGAALTYFSSYIMHADFGVYTPVVVTVWSVIVNTLSKFIPNTAVVSDTIPPAAPTA